MVPIMEDVHEFCGFAWMKQSTYIKTREPDPTTRFGGFRCRSNYGLQRLLGVPERSVLLHIYKT